MPHAPTFLSRSISFTEAQCASNMAQANTVTVTATNTLSECMWLLQTQNNHLIKAGTILYTDSILQLAETSKWDMGMCAPRARFIYSYLVIRRVIHHWSGFACFSIVLIHIHDRADWFWHLTHIHCDPVEFHSCVWYHVIGGYLRLYVAFNVLPSNWIVKCSLRVGHDDTSTRCPIFMPIISPTRIRRRRFLLSAFGIATGGLKSATYIGHRPW